MVIDTERLLNAPALKEKGPDTIALIHDALILISVCVRCMIDFLSGKQNFPW